jgi:DNA-directed RNA polymerase specialized sigma24 family protein
LSRDQDVAVARFPAGADPERVASAREGLAQFAGELSGLGEAHAEVVYMHDVLGHELTEIAVLLGITVAAAQSRLVRGRRRMDPGARRPERNRAPPNRAPVEPAQV